MDLSENDYVEYINDKGETAEGYIVGYAGFIESDIYWIGEKPGTLQQKVAFVFAENIVKRVPPPLA